MDPKQLLKNIEKLSAVERIEAEDLIAQLAAKHSKNAPNEKAEPPKFTWEGGLADLKEDYTSSELKKKALDWM